MDNKQLLENIKELTGDMRQDIRDLAGKIDNYQERLIKVESTLGFIKTSLASAVSLVGLVVSYIIYKVIDIYTGK